MNNKPNTAPLCSSTRSGKIIDELIKSLGDGFIFEKSNLYDLDYWPVNPEKNTPTIYDWAKRIEFTTDDIVVTLGSAVNDRFKKWPYKYVYIGHPSMRGGIKGTKAEYISRAKTKILEFAEGLRNG